MTAELAGRTANRPKLTPLDELDELDLTAWRELADRSAEPNPYFHPDFVIAAARGLGEQRKVGVLRIADDDGWSACLPVCHYRRWHGIPLPCTAAWKHPYSLLGTPLVAPDRHATVLPAAVEAMLDSSRAAFAAFEVLGADGPAAAALEVGTAVSFDSYQRAALQRRPNPDYLGGNVKGKHRREFRRLAERLEEECGGQLELVDRTGEGQAVETFLRLENSGWKGEAGTALASNPAHADFFRAIVRDFANRGSLELRFLEAGGQPVAARCSLLAGGVNFCFKVAYDERYGRFSPGRELELRQMTRFHAEHELVRMDSCTAPGNELFNRLWPDRQPISSVVVCTPGPRGAVAKRAILAAVAVRDRRRSGR